MKETPPSDLRIDILSLLRVAIPISLGTMIQFIVVLTDNFFLSRAGEAAINGAGNAGLVYLTFEMLAIGSGASFQIMIARRLGEHNRLAALNTFRTGLLFHLGLGLVLTVITALLNQGALNSLIADAETAAVFTPFLAIRMLGYVPLSVVLALNAFYTGAAKTWPILVIAGLMAGLNVVLDAAWVEGWWGVQPMGPLGAAWASLTAEWVGCLAGIALTIKVVPDLRSSMQFLDREAFRKWWHLARPLMGQLLLTIATWTSFFFLVEKVGGMELKVSHIARNLFMLAFVVAQGMGQTTRTYISNLLGAQHESLIPAVLKRIVLLNITGILMACHGFVLYPERLASIFFDDPVGIEAMRKTLYVIFSAVTLYAFTGIALAVLQGSGATKEAFRVELLAVSMYVAAAVAMTIVWPQPVWVIWRVEWIYFSLIGLGSFWFLRKGNWRTAMARH